MQLRRVILAALLAGACLMPLSASAQGLGGSASMPSDHTIHVTPAMLDAFVDAAIMVTGIGTIWQPKIDAAKSKDEAQKIIAKVREEMRQAVEDTPGITMTEYLAIVRTAKRNPKVAALIRRKMAEKQAADAKAGAGAK